MAGNTSNTSLWEGADVYIAPEGTIGPADLVTAWGSGWALAGLLDGESGFTEAREEETSEHYAWGGILYKRTKSNHKRTIAFVALEDNATIFGLLNPGSDRSSDAGMITSTVRVPTTDRFAIGFEVREGDKIKRRIVKSAEVDEVGEITESSANPTVYEITTVLFPEADGTLYTELATDPSYVAPDPVV